LSPDREDNDRVEGLPHGSWRKQAEILDKANRTSEPITNISVTGAFPSGKVGTQLDAGLRQLAP
jgi:hypothetical protein